MFIREGCSGTALPCPLQRRGGRMRTGNGAKLCGRVARCEVFHAALGRSRIGRCGAANALCDARDRREEGVGAGRHDAVHGAPRAEQGRQRIHWGCVRATVCNVRIGNNGRRRGHWSTGEKTWDEIFGTKLNIIPRLIGHLAYTSPLRSRSLFIAANRYLHSFDCLLLLFSLLT